MSVCIHPEYFEKNQREIIALTMTGRTAARIGKAEYWTARVPLLAYIDCATGELITEKSSLTWDELSDEKLYDLEAEKCYRLTVRKALEKTPGGTRLFVDAMNGETAADARLEAVLAEYRKPVTLTLPDGNELTLEKSLSVFGGSVEWLGDEVDLSFSVDEPDGTTADTAIKTYVVLSAKREDFTARAKHFAAESLCDLATDWADSSDTPHEVTEDEFISRIELCGISIDEDGKYTLWFSDGDMFWGHSVTVYGSLEEGFTNAEMEG